MGVSFERGTHVGHHGGGREVGESGLYLQELLHAVLPADQLGAQARPLLLREHPVRAPAHLIAFEGLGLEDRVQDFLSVHLLTILSVHQLI